MTRGLISARVKIEGDHHGTTVMGSANIRTTIMIWGVGIVELLGEFIVDGDTMGRNAEGINSSGTDIGMNSFSSKSHLIEVSRVSNIGGGEGDTSSKFKNGIRGD